MADEKLLNRLFKDYRNNLIGRKDFEAKLYEHILKHPESVGLYGPQKEDYVELLCELYPRLSRSVDKYNPGRGSFSTYINNMVKFARKEYRLNRRMFQEREYIYMADDIQEKMLRENEPEFYLPELPQQLKNTALDDNKNIRLGKINSKPAVFSRKQIMILILKSYYFLSESFINRIAARSGIDKTVIHLYVERLHLIRLKQEASLMKARQRHNLQRLRCIMFESRLRKYEKGTIQYRILSEKIRGKREKLKLYREKFRAMRREASNREIALALGISKGTVDSSMFYIKQKWNGLCKAGAEKEERKSVRRKI